ncbi:MAG: single-stranded DNA-binding protein [Candidatus Eisenbacteria bacterium]
MEGTTYPRMNRVFLTGIAQEEPELRYTPSGVTVCSFRVQVGRILRDRSGGAREVAAYLTVVAWQETAQRMARDLRKGQAMYVEGYLSTRSFTTARGDKRTAVEIYAEQIQILGPFLEERPAEEGSGEKPHRQNDRRRPGGGPRAGEAPAREGAGAAAGPEHEARHETTPPHQDETPPHEEPLHVHEDESEHAQQNPQEPTQEHDEGTQRMDL